MPYSWLSSTGPGWRRPNATSSARSFTNSAPSVVIICRATSIACRPAGESDSSSRLRNARSLRSSLPSTFGTPWWNNVAWMRCYHAFFSSIRSLYNRALVRISSTNVGGIHDSGTSPFSSITRSRFVSSRSVFARFFGPRD